MPLASVAPILKQVGIKVPINVKLMPFLMSLGFDIQNPKGQSGYEVVHVSTPMCSTVPSEGDAAISFNASDNPHFQTAATAAVECDKSTVLSGGASSAAEATVEHDEDEDEDISPEEIQCLLENNMQNLMLISEHLTYYDFPGKIKFIKLLLEHLALSITKGSFDPRQIQRVNEIFPEIITDAIARCFPFTEVSDIFRMILRQMKISNLTCKDGESGQIILAVSLRNCINVFDTSIPLDTILKGFSVQELVEFLILPKSKRDHVDVIYRYFTSFFLVSEISEINSRVYGMLRAAIGYNGTTESLYEEGACTLMRGMSYEVLLTVFMKFRSTLVASDLLDPSYVTFFQNIELTHPSKVCIHSIDENCTKGVECGFSHLSGASKQVIKSGGGAAAAPATPPVRVMLPLAVVAAGRLCKHYVNKGECTYPGCVFDHRLPRGHASSETPDCTSCANSLCCGPHGPECPNVPAPKQKKK